MGCYASKDEQSSAAVKSAGMAVQDEPQESVDVGVQHLTELNKLGVFSELDQVKLKKMAKLLTRVVYSANSVVYREGHVDDRFMVLASGEAVVTSVDRRGFHTELRELYVGDVVGEATIFRQGHVHRTTLSTLTDCVLYVLDAKKNKEFARTVPQLYAELESNWQQRESMMDALNAITAFKNLRTDKRHVMLEFCAMKKYAASKRIVEEGEQAFSRRLYLIVSGTVECIVGKKKVSTLSKGDYFGDVSVMSEEPNYRATIQVSKSGPLTVLEIARDDFLALLNEEESVLSEFALRVSGSKCNLRDVLQHPVGRSYFEGHLAKEFTAEHIQFWLAVEQFEAVQRTLIRKCVLRTLGIAPETFKEFKAAMMRSMALDIARTYLAPISPMQVNVSGAVSSQIIDRCKKKDISFDMFDKAKAEVYDLLYADNWSRFLKSEEFPKLLKEVGAYELNIERKIPKRKQYDTNSLKKPLNMTRLRQSLEREGVERPTGRPSIGAGSSSSFVRKDGSQVNLLEALESEPAFLKKDYL